MQRGCIPDGADPHRFVGDPVDVVTGANTSVERDFRLAGAIPIDWRRHVDSSRAHRRFALGWGHSHEYDRSLRIDADGLRYVGPLGRGINFPSLAADGDRAVQQGVALQRVSPMRYRIEIPGSATFEFDLGDGARPAPPCALVDGICRVEFAYRADGALQRIAETNGRRLDIECDDARRVTRVVLAAHAGRPERQLVAYRYDEAGHLVEGIDAYRHAFSFAYDDAHRLVRRVDRRGYAFLFDYDAKGRCTHSRGEDGLYEVRLDYRPEQRLTRVTEADGGVWIYGHDDHGVLDRIVDPCGGVRRFVLDGDGRVLEEIDPNGDATRWVYDRHGAFEGRVSSLGHFFPGHAPMFRPDQRRHRVPGTPAQWIYGDLPETLTAGATGALANGLRALVQHAMGDGATASPEPLPLGDETETLHDELGLPMRETRADGSARSWGYDAGGNTLRHRDFGGSTIEARYASWDLPTVLIDPLGRRLERRFLRTGQVSEVVDVGGVRSGFVRDLKGRIVEYRYDGRCRERYRHDAADNEVQVLDGDGQPLVTRVIGPHNLEVERVLASGGVERFSYTPAGRYATLASEGLEVRFDYDRLGQRTLDERNGRGVSHVFAGVRTLAGTTVLQRFVTRYRRIDAATLEIVDPAGGCHRIQRVGDGIMLRTGSDGQCEAARFDRAGRCVVAARSGARAAGWEAPRWSRHEYSADGDLLAALSERGSTRYRYDAAHRLTEAVANGRPHAQFMHDDGDNLLGQPGLDGVSIGPGHRLLAANGEQFEHDAQGNLTLRRGPHGETRYRYDASRRLVACEMPRGVWQAAYDPLGRRTRKWMDDGSSREFVWDTDRLAAEIDQDGRLQVYIYADAFAMTPLLRLDYDSVEQAASEGRRRFIESDHLGTPVRVTDDAGTLLWAARISPYGEAEIEPGARIEMALRFPGHYFDAETGLHCNRFRYYVPTWGRYLQTDPLGTEQGTNPYAYPANPLNGVDVRGDCKKDGTKQDDDDSTEGGKKAATDDDLPPGMTRAEYEAHKAEMKAIADATYKKMMEANADGKRTITLEDGTVLKTSDSGMGPCLSVVKDLKTGEIFFGQNTGKEPDNLAPQLQKRTDVVVAVNQSETPAPSNYPEGWTRSEGIPGSHSEVQALNQGMQARPDSRPEDFAVYNVDTQGTRGREAGDPMPRCGNCAPITDGVVPMTDG